MIAGLEIPDAWVGGPLGLHIVGHRDGHPSVGRFARCVLNVVIAIKPLVSCVHLRTLKWKVYILYIMNGEHRGDSTSVGIAISILAVDWRERNVGPWNWIEYVCRNSKTSQMMSFYLFTYLTLETTSTWGEERTHKRSSSLDFITVHSSKEIHEI